MDKTLYPIHFVLSIVLADGTPIVLRPIKAIDAKKAATFKSRLSLDSLYQRFLGSAPKISKELSKKFTEIDYETEMAIVAELGKDTAQEESHELIAVSRLVPLKNKNTAEFAIIIADKWQGKGLGAFLTHYMIYIAELMKFKKISALVFSTNIGMLEILRKNGFEFRKYDDLTLKATLILANMPVTERFYELIKDYPVPFKVKLPQWLRVFIETKS